MEKKTFIIRRNSFMEIIVNGDRKNLVEEISVSKLLDSLEIKRVALAVELNKQILPKTEYDKTILKDGDVIEIVQFVGGG